MNKIDITYRELLQGRMETPEDRLRFAVEFSQVDLLNLRPGDLLNLRDDLYLFVHGHPNERVFPGGISATESSGSIREFSSDDMRSLQAETYAALHSSATISGTSAALPISVHLSLSRNPSNWKKKNVLELLGSSRDCFLMILFHLLSQEPVNRIQACPGCNRIFYKAKRQKYCSRRCSNRVYMREYRSTENGKVAISDANHAQYSRRTKKRIGKPVKIARRPRRS